MNALLVKLLAVGLTISQVFTKSPELIKTQFDPQADQAEVGTLLHEGCDYLSKEFHTQNLNLTDVMDLAVMFGQTLKTKAEQERGNELDGTAPPSDGGTGKKSLTSKMMVAMDFEGLRQAYLQLCEAKAVENSRIKLDEVIAFYNNAMKDLPDPTKLKGLRLPEVNLVLDREGKRFGELYTKNGRRAFVPISELNDYVKNAFVAAEDQHFRQHKGIDSRGIIRAFYTSMSGKGRPQGGSTITQQVIKNLLVGDDLTFERKMREMVLAVRTEKLLNKDEILELYLNYVYLGRASWGIEMAAKSYFGKSARELTLNEAATLAGLVKGPNYYNPDRFPDRIKDRLGYVLGRMRDDGYINEDQLKMAKSKEITTARFETPHSFYYMDEILRDIKRKVGVNALEQGSIVIRSTIHPDLQKTAEQALQDGLAAYEASSGRSEFKGPVGSIAEDIEKYDSTWQEQMAINRSTMYDVRWPLAVILGRTLQTSEGKVYTTRDTKIGLADGRVASLVGSTKALRTLKLYDLIFVKLNESKGGLTATIMNPPTVQGAIVVMEAKTGRVLALSGGFSYGASKVNRVTQSPRQPGSTLKPFIYLSAMNLGYQPNTLVPDVPFSLPPIAKGGHWWSPRNYDGGSRGVVTFRRAVESSLNLPTARVMATMACRQVSRSQCVPDATKGLDYIRMITHELGIYENPVRVYPFVLGAQPTRLIDMAVAYATVANIALPGPPCPTCLKPVPRFFDSIEQNGKLITQRLRVGESGTSDQPSLVSVPSLDRVALYQIRRILEGTLARGTAVALKDLAGYVGGKTGTSNNYNDAWFMGFTNDLVVGVWVGYDSRRVKSTLGSRATGAQVALPIAAKVLRRSFEVYKPMERLSPLPFDLKNKVVEYPIDVRSGEFNAGDFLEVFRIGTAGAGSPANTRSSLLRGSELSMALSDPYGEEGNPYEMQVLNEGEDGYEYGQPLEPEGGYYEPGAENMADLWRQQGRKVDPSYYKPPFFNYNP